jgi:hypothetical protein
MPSPTPCTLTIEVRTGPVMRTALDVLEHAAELYELVPEWHAAEREELRQRTRALVELVQDTLTARAASEG